MRSCWSALSASGAEFTLCPGGIEPARNMLGALYTLTDARPAVIIGCCGLLHHGLFSRGGGRQHGPGFEIDGLYGTVDMV